MMVIRADGTGGQSFEFCVRSMEDGGVDTTVIESSQHDFILKMCGPIIENEHLWVCY